MRYETWSVSWAMGQVRLAAFEDSVGRRTGDCLNSFRAVGVQVVGRAQLEATVTGKLYMERLMNKRHQPDEVVLSFLATRSNFGLALSIEMGVRTWLAG